MRLGKYKRVFSFLGFLFYCASSFGQTGLSYNYHFDGDSAKCELIPGNQSFTIMYSISELTIVNLNNPDGTFYRVSIPGHVSSSVPGNPELPVFSRIIAVPEGFRYSVRISEIKSSRIKPSGKKFKGILYPVQVGETKATIQDNRKFLIDKNVYSIHGFVPSDTVRIEPLGTVRNKSLANLFINPVHYNPGKNIIEVITSMKVDITFTTAQSAKSLSSHPESELFARVLDKSLINYDPGEVIPGYSTQPVRMVILTDTSFRKQLLPYFKWKTQKGFKLKVLYKGAGLAGTTYTALKDTLAKIYNSGSADDPAPEYLLIIGDVSHIPRSDVTSNISDMYYGEFDGGGDYLPDMYIGRIPAADTSQVRNVVNKIIQYEKFQFSDTNKFYNRALITAGNDAVYSLNMNGQLNYVLDNYLKISNKIDEYHFFYPQSTLPLVEDSIKKLFRKGVSFINYTGHGDASGWLDPVIRSMDVDSLRNKNMYPFTISNACRTAQFSSATSFGNRMVLSKDKGAIGFIGCSNDSYWDEDYFWAVGSGAVSLKPSYPGTGLGAFDRLFHRYGESPADWYFTMGQVVYAGNLAVSASTSARKQYYWETYNLIGDPSVIPIIGKPGSLTVSIPDTLPNGIKSLTLKADPFTYLAVSHADTLWDASFASPSGSVELTMPGLSNDSCLIVVTGQNKIPLIKTVRISKIKGEFINLSSSTINDSEGNNNKRVDFGETFFLNLTISNLGQSNASNLYAKISSSSGLLTINQDSVYIGTLAARSEKILASDLGMTISGNVIDMGIVTVDLLLKDTQTEKHYKIDICVHAPELSIANCVINDTIEGNKNNVADPGETFYLIFKVINQGSSNVSGQFYVTSKSPDLTVLDPNVKSGDIKFGATVDIPVKVKLSENISSGSFISLSSLLDCSPFILNKDFSFRVGKIRESFESLGFNVFPWINVSEVPWIITDTSPYDGIVSARSGHIGHNSSTSLIIRTELASDDSLKFYYKMSSEPSYDNLSFRINDTEVFKKSGEIPWSRIAVPVAAGTNKLEWRYSKDQSVSSGADCAWIDLIDFAESSPVTYIEKDLQVARIVAPVQKNKFGQETVSVKLLNLGKDPISGFNLAYRVNDHGNTVAQSFDNIIMPYSDSVTVSFSTKANLSAYGAYNITAYAYGNDDDYLLNDTARVYLENNQLADSLNVYPNPFSTQFTLYIQSLNNDRLRISVINNSGTKFYEMEKEITSGMNSIIFPGLILSPGMYYLKIKGSTIDRTIPVIKMKK